MSIVIDEVIVICKGCSGERTVRPPKPLVGADEVHRWIQQGVPPCACGATHCDLKMHLVPEN